MSDGGITVTKTTTGSLFLNDIQVAVHHQEATYIPADKALNSADLHRALNSGMIFQMLNTMHTKPQGVAQAAALEEENRTLREALQRSTQQSANLQNSVDTLAKQVEALAGAVGKIGTVAPQQIVIPGAVPGATYAAKPEVVGGDVPMFIQDNIVPVGADVQVAIKETLTEDDGVSEAQSKLRKLRRG